MYGQTAPMAYAYRLRCCINLWLACADANMQRSFVRKFLARQPSLPFSKTRKLLGMKPTPQQKKRIAERLSAGPMQGMTTVAGSGGSKRKRNSHPGRWQPGTSMHGIALLNADDIPITQWLQHHPWASDAACQMTCKSAAAQLCYYCGACDCCIEPSKHKHHCTHSTDMR